MTATSAAAGGQGADGRTAVAILASLSVCHLLNDTIQSVLPAIYPLLQRNYALTFTQIGLLHLSFQLTASLLQPAVGLYTDRRPMFRLASLGMGASLVGLLLLSAAGSYWMLLPAAMLMGVGSSIFHPDSSRVARAASGGRFGLAQSVFQVGGNVGTALGPLLAAFIVLPFGQGSIAWFALLALAAMLVLWNVGTWARDHHLRSAARGPGTVPATGLSPWRTATILSVLAGLVFSKFIYVSSLNSYYTFFLIDRFGLSVGQSQLMLFVFLAAVAAGTLLGGPVGDRFGRKLVIWVSIFGVLPFTLALPHANLFWTGVLTVIIGVVIASAFSAIIVYAQALLPGRVGMVSGLFFGFAFGMSAIGAAALGMVADWKGIAFVYQACAFLPLLGLLAVFLPPEEALRRIG